MIMSSSELGCVICSKPLVATQFDSPPPPDIDHVDFVRKLSDSVWPKILQYLLIPSQKFSEVLEVCRDEGFCPECFAIVLDIGKLQEKLLTLELMIQNKVETLGKALAAAAGPASTFRKSKKFQEVWKKFRLPVVNSKERFINVGWNMFCET
jgi:acetyl-CoA carboxylase alpha subunit